MIERSHQTLKQILKINVAADSSRWQKYVNMAAVANTTYHQAIRCAPTEFFQGRVTFNALDVKFGNPLTEPHNPLRRHCNTGQQEQKCQETHTNNIEAFYNYKTY